MLRRKRSQKGQARMVLYPSRTVFGALLRQQRVQANLSQALLAQRTGLTQKAISRFERGETVPTLDVWVQLSRELQAPVLINVLLKIADFDVVRLLQESYARTLLDFFDHHLNGRMRSGHEPPPSGGPTGKRVLLPRS
jgi:transcriptional regulator with XRE-family HTH domain